MNNSGYDRTATIKISGTGITDISVTVFQNSTVGISESYEKGHLKIYPNPFTAYIELSFNSSSEVEVELSIVDMTGRLIQTAEHKIKEGLNTIKVNELENIPSGIYFLRMQNGASVLTSKLIKQ